MLTIVSGPGLLERGKTFIFRTDDPAFEEVPVKIADLWMGDSTSELEFEGLAFPGTAKERSATGYYNIAHSVGALTLLP